MGSRKPNCTTVRLGVEPLAIDVAGHPDDQQVGIEFLGARLGERPGRAPLADRLHDRLEVTAGGVRLHSRVRLGARPALDDLSPLERAHAVGEDRARDPWEAALELVEAARAAEHLAHDQEASNGSPRISVALATGQYCA